MNLFASQLFHNAFVAATIVAVVVAPVGYFLVLRSNAFAGEALKDVGFAGAAGAALLGFGSITGMVALSLLAAIGLGFLGERMRGRDIEVGMVLSFALGLGVLFLSVWARSSASHASSGMTILFGSVLTIGRSDVYLALGSGAVALAALAAVYRPLLFASVDPTVAAARGVPMRTLSLAFMIILALTVSTSVLIVGVLLVGALLITPAGAAVNLARSPRSALLLTLAISLGSTWAGLALAFAPIGRSLPVGFTISAVASIAYFLSALSRQRSVRAIRNAPTHPSREVHA